MEMIQLEDDPLDGPRLFKCKFRGKGPFALKKMEWTSGSGANWQSLIGLRNENVVSYLHCDVSDSISYLVMDLCWASMLDFCLGRLLDVSDVDMSRMMSETARGLHFLHQSHIIHGRLGLDRVLLWRKRPNVKPIAKISGYYPHHQQPKIEDDLKALGRIFYSMAANDVNPPKELPVSPKQLTLIGVNQRTSASQMVNLLLMDSNNKSKRSKPTSVGDLLLGQSFFQTGSINQDRLRNVKELDDFKELIDGRIKDDVEGLKELIVESLAANQDIGQFVTESLEKYPQLIAEFIWDVSSYTPLETLTFVERPLPSKLGSGAAGMVLAGQWIKGNGQEMAVACKRFYRHNNGTAKFDREYQTLRQLDHLFVIKCFGACEIEFDKCILMELCEGTLQNYVSGELERIPKDSLDDRNILGQVTLGLSYIHSKELIHKDLKPSHILLWQSQQKSLLVLAKLADFDFAKQSRTGRGDFSGTFRPGTEGYMAPELLEGLSAHHRMAKVLATVHSDAYSLGIVIGFTVLKGRHPFGNEKTRDTIMKSGADPVLLGNLDWDVTDLILRLTRKDPKERPNVSLLIYHPYFVLANDKTKAHFADKLDDYFNLYESPYEARITFVNRDKIQKWMDVISSQTEREENAEVKKWLDQMSGLVLQETTSNSQEYYEKIKKEIQTDNDNDVSKNFHNDVSKSHRFLEYFRDWPLWTRRLIQSAPRFAVSYFWCFLNDRTEDSPPPNRPIKVKHPHQFRIVEILKIEEHVHACLHLKRREEIEEMWNCKRAGQLEAGLVSDREIHCLLRELPLYATPPSVISNLINRLVNINSSYHQDERTVLHWMLRNRWKTIDVSIVVELLQKKKADPNVGDKQGSTPVHYAAKNESSEGPTILKLLLVNGGDPGKRNGPKRRIPLHYAAMNESCFAPSIVNILLACDACNVNVFDKHGFTPLHYAARNKSMEAPGILNCLLDKGRDPDINLFRFGMVQPFQRTPVHIATMNETQSGLRMLKLLLKRKGDPNAQDSDKETPVHYAAKNRSQLGPDMMETLLENKGNVNVFNIINGQGPIHLAAQNTSSSAPSLMETILKHGGDPDTPFRDGESAVHLAAANDSKAGMQMLQLLLDQNGDPNQKDRWARSPVHKTAQSQFLNGPNVLQLLLDNGGDPNSLDSDGKTPVHLAAANNSGLGPDLLNVLLVKGGKVEVFDKTRKTPTHLAAANESESGLDILKILLKNGADPDAVDENQETPVHYAARNESNSAPIILQFLLENKGNCNALNRWNQTPIDLAIKNTSDSTPKLLTILLEKDFNPNARNSRGVTSIHLAAANESASGPEILKLLLENGRDCHVVDGDNRTLLHYAAENRSEVATEMVKILLDKGCDPNASSIKGVTPAHLAAKNKGSSGLNILKLLHEKGANLNVADDGGTTAVHLAAQAQERKDIMKYLLDNGDGDVDINAFDVCRDDVMRYVIPDINWRIEEQRLLPDGKRKRTPVHYAAENETISTVGSDDVLRLVLERGGNPNLEDERKRTPVHLAVRNGGLTGSELLKVLLKHKGNPNAVDDQLMTPVHFAAKVELTSDKVKRMKLLMKHGGNADAVDSSGLTPVHYASMNDSNLAPQMIELLLANNGNPNAVDPSGLTPVHYCLIKNPSARVAEKILELLMKHGGDPDFPDHEGKTPIDLLAAMEQSTEMENMWRILKLNQRH